VRLRFKRTLIEIIEVDKLLFEFDRIEELFSLEEQIELKTQKMITKRHCNVDDEDSEVVVREEKEVKVVLKKEKEVESERRRENERLKIERLRSGEEIELLYNEIRATFTIVRLA
jgi:hypothetical protein